MSDDHAFHGPAAIRSDLGAVFVSLELSRGSWLITSLSPGSGEKISRHTVLAATGLGGLLARLRDLQAKAGARLGRPCGIVLIMEAGLDGFWVHRALEAEGVESHVVDAASVAVSRRGRRAKSDKIDGEALLRTLMAYKRGEPRVCSMVRAPSPQDEDRRRVCRERKTLVAERTEHINRVKGLLLAQGIGDYEPARGDRRRAIEDLRTGDGRPLPEHLKRQIDRELDRLELTIAQIRQIEAERDALLAVERTPGSKLARLRGVGPEFSAVLGGEAFYRHFDNRRQLAAYAGLAASPWKSGSIDREQGVSKAGNPRLRATLVQLAWLWLRHQPTSALSLWFHQRVQLQAGRMRRVMIVALARKLLIALWRFETKSEVPAGAVLKAA
jgi:transposase